MAVALADVKFWILSAPNDFSIRDLAAAAIVAVKLPQISCMVGQVRVPGYNPNGQRPACVVGYDFDGIQPGT